MTACALITTNTETRPNRRRLLIQHDAQASRGHIFVYSALTNTCEALAKRKRWCWVDWPTARLVAHSKNRPPGMTALPAEATGQLRAAWPLRYSALATDQSYRLMKMESGDVGCAATSAKRHSAGAVPGMTALVVVSTSHRTPQSCKSEPPSWLLIDTCEALMFIRFSRRQTQRVGPTVIKVDLF